MSSDGVKDDSYTDAPPKDRAFEALDTFEERVSDLGHMSVGERVREETQAFEDLVTTLGKCYANGLNMPAGIFADAVADNSRLTKTEAKQEIANTARKKSGNGRTPLNEWTADNLQEVRVVRTTDSVQDTGYVWDFGDTTVETESGSEGREHYNWQLFRDAIKDAGGPYLDAPDGDLKGGEEWRNFIVNLQEDNETTKVYEGPRTSAVQYLQNRVRNAEGYGDLEAAVDYNGVYVEVNNDPPEGEDPVDTDSPTQACPLWRVDLVMVPNKWANDAADEFGISTRALQIELDARNYTLANSSSVSETEYVAGQHLTFWALNGSFAAPAAYQPEGTVSESQDTLEKDADQENTETDFGTLGGN